MNVISRVFINSLGKTEANSFILDIILRIWVNLTEPENSEIRN